MVKFPDTLTKRCKYRCGFLLDGSASHDQLTCECMSQIVKPEILSCHNPPITYFGRFLTDIVMYSSHIVVCPSQKPKM